MHFNADEKQEFLKVEQQWFIATTLSEHWRSILDCLGQDGWVRHESYEKVVELNRRLKKEWLDKAEDPEDSLCIEKHWPFQDHEEFA